MDIVKGVMHAGPESLEAREVEAFVVGVEGTAGSVSMGVVGAVHSSTVGTSEWEQIYHPFWADRVGGGGVKWEIMLC